MTGRDLLLEDLVVGWDATPVLRIDQLHVAAGETVALLGRSGSGKSTLLRTVAGLLAPIAGRIAIAGHDQVGVPPHERGVGLVFQGQALFPHATAGENVAFAAAVAGMPRGARRRLARDWLARVGLEGLDDRDVATLSGGQRQRVALARTLAAEPAVVLLDEPLGALDTGLRSSLLADLRSLFDDLGTTAVLVTHDPTEAASLADRIAVVGDGRLAQVGTASQLHRAPATATVARLVGHPNVVRGEAIGVQGGGEVVVPVDAVEVVDTRDDGLTGTVTALRPGPAWTAEVRLASGAVLLGVVDAGRAPVVGTTVGLVVDADRIVRLVEN